MVYSERVFDESPELLRDLSKKLPAQLRAKTLRQCITDGRMNMFLRTRIYLEYIRFPQGYATSVAAVLRFLRALNVEPEKKPKKRRKNCSSKS